METIILLILFILIPLANYVIERMRRRYEPPPPDSRRVPDMGMRRQAAPPPPAFSARRERAQETPPTIAVQPSRSRRFRQTLFRNKRDVRRTIVAMTILGPCRAYDPPN
ncbi:MAG: hypothetical protein ACREQ2_05070 [Candidatus Binatia bacterium]